MGFFYFGDEKMRKFKKIYIEITNICNLQCSFCPETSREGRFMKLDEFSYILDEIKAYTDYIYLHVKGEPLLHPNIDEFLDISYKKGLKVNLTTNGTLLNEKKHKLLGKPALRQVNISLHSFDGNNLSRDKNDYLDIIFDFINSSRNEKDLIIALRLWNLNEDNYLNKKKYKNKEILERIQQEFNLPLKLEDILNPQRGIKIAERIYLNQDTEFIWPSLENEIFGHKGFCYGLRDQLGILVDGTVIPCCLDGEGKISLGNIFNSKLETILNHNRAKVIFDGFSKRMAVEEMCKRCGFRSRFD